MNAHEERYPGDDVDSYFVGQVIDGPLGRYTLRTAAQVALRRAVSGSGNPVIVETPAMPELPIPHEERYPNNDVDSYLTDTYYRYEEIYSDTVDDLIIGYEVYAPGNDSDHPDRIEYDPAYLPDPELPIPHYHVMSSMAGHLPDYNEIHDTRDDARQDAAWYVEAYDDMNAASDEFPDYYDIDARDPDHIVVGRGGPDSYAVPIIVEVVECLDHTCTREND